MKLTHNQLLLAFKNHLMVVFTFFCLVTAVHAQNIPDANFAAGIRAACPTCIDASNNLLAPATNITQLIVSGRSITNLSGIEGFTRLRTLDCSSNQLTSLPTLPSSLTSLSCGLNRLTTLPALPSGLTFLGCFNNQITSFPTLPNTLQNIYAQDNRLTGIPNFPTSLLIANISNNNIFCLPSIPNSVNAIGLDANKITCLPNAPRATIFNASGISVVLPLCAPTINLSPTVAATPLPIGSSLTLTARATGNVSSVIWYKSVPPYTTSTPVTSNLSYTANTLATYTIPALTQSDNAANYFAIFQYDNSCGTTVVISGSARINVFQSITIPDANFAEAIRGYCPSCITPLPNNILTFSASNLQFLNVTSRNISNLAGIEGLTGLRTFICSLNNLTNLPTLPSSLTQLNCSRNNLTNLPTLPSSLTQLKCDNNQLSSLPNLPSGLTSLYLHNNRFTNLPNLPSGLTELSCFNNPITSLPFLPSSLTLLFLDPDRTPCLPNAVPGLVTRFGVTIYNLPVCSGSACSPTIVASTVVTTGNSQNPCLAESTTLTASANAVGTATMTITWQRKRPNDADFVNLTEPVAYVSGTPATYTVSVSTADNNNQYRAVFSGTCAGAVAIGTAPAQVSTRQGAHIADIYFQRAIRRDCPTCINGCNNLTADAETITRLNIDNASSFQPITDLSGIEGFLNLEELNIGSNTITNFPRLPNNLKKLTINNNNLSTLPELPSTLEVLICKNNNLTSLPTLPSSLMHLDCSSNKLTELPADLPEGLMVLDCSNNHLIGLPPSLPIVAIICSLICHRRYRQVYGRWCVQEIQHFTVCRCCPKVCENCTFRQKILPVCVIHHQG
jgi:Leucine-rich repeat (LRR) protein